MPLFCWSVISDWQFQIQSRGNFKDSQRHLETFGDIMNKFQRHFTEEAFLFSTFVEFNKCWRSGKKSRLVIESINGFAFVNFSAFLGHPKTVHVAPPEKDKLGRKSRKKSKKKTERDNERAARFQARKRQCESDAAASEASKGPCPPPATSSPLSAFIFSEPTPENMSSNSNFADLNIDGNVTISSEISRTEALLEELRTDVGKSTGNSSENYSIHASTPVKTQVPKSSTREVLEAQRHNAEVAATKAETEVNERKERGVCYLMCVDRKLECFCHYARYPPSRAHVRKVTRDVV